MFNALICNKAFSMSIRSQLSGRERGLVSIGHLSRCQGGPLFLRLLRLVCDNLCTALNVPL